MSSPTSQDCDPAAPGTVALLGGTFDPPHAGHLHMALAVQERLGVPVVHFLPAPVPPHKAGTIASFEDRLRMVELLIAGHPGLVASDLEARLPAPHYTVRTLRHLAGGSLAGRRLMLIIGADSLRDLHTWREAPALFELAQVVAVSRPGYPLSNAHLPPGLVERVIRLDAVHEDVSSHELRRRLLAGEAPQEVPPAVMAYIRERGLYR